MDLVKVLAVSISKFVNLFKKVEIIFQQIKSKYKVCSYTAMHYEVLFHSTEDYLL
jgi:hypothetical protein